MIREGLQIKVYIFKQILESQDELNAKWESVPNID